MGPGPGPANEKKKNTHTLNALSQIFNKYSPLPDLIVKTRDFNNSFIILNRTKYTKPRNVRYLTF